MGKDTLSFEIWIFRSGQPVHDFDRKMFYSFKKKVCSHLGHNVVSTECCSVRKF